MVPVASPRPLEMVEVSIRQLRNRSADGHDSFMRSTASLRPRSISEAYDHISPPKILRKTIKHRL